MSSKQRKNNSNNKDYVIKIPPFHYLHLLNTNKNVTRVVTGPQTLTCLEDEQVVHGPAHMVVVPPRHYVIVDNPVVTTGDKDDSGQPKVVMDTYGSAKLRHGDSEVRLSGQPFPLYPGEKISGSVKPLVIVAENTALRLHALRTFEDIYAPDGPELRQAGEVWLFYGPATYIPQVQVEMLQTVKAVILRPLQALQLRARDDCTDWKNKERKAGEQWLVQTIGAYLPQANEEIVKTITAKVLTHSKAIHVRAERTYTDKNGIERKAGTEWLVTSEDATTYIPSVNETITREINATTIRQNQYVVINDPVGEDGKPQLGMRKLVRGPRNLFLQPGERLEGGHVKAMFVLDADTALFVRAKEEFVDRYGGGSVKRRPGNRWYVYGPGEYCPPLEVDVLPKRARAFVSVDGLGLHLFHPGQYAGLFLLFAILYILYIRYM